MSSLTSHLIFDFFGTLVDYSPSRTSQGFPSSYAYYQSLGGDLEYKAYLESWSAGFSELDEETASSLREYSMVEATAAFQRHASFDGSAEALAGLTSIYLDEWNKGVRSIAGVPAMLERLADSFGLSIITNTHDPQLVPDHLERLGVSHLFTQVVTSVSFGFRKPSATIFEFALAGLEVAPGQCIYIGDSLVPDFEGPRSVGIRPLLIDADGSAPVAHHERIASILDLEALLSDG